MKILFITGSLNQGGAEFQILKLLQLFKIKGHDVELFALTNYDFYLPFLENNEISYSHLQNFQNKFKRVLLTAKKIKKTRPDVIISYLRVPSQVSLVAKFLSRVDTKLIIGERTSLVIPNYDRFYFNLMRLANAVSVNSISKLNYIQSNFKQVSSKTYFFPNILDVNEISFLDKKYDQEKLHLGFIGRISPEKNILEMIKAVGLLKEKGKEIRFSIYGDGRNADYLEQVTNLILSEGLTEEVQLMGKTNEVLEVYKKIDLLILISDYEGFSNVISEALASGLPIITSAIPENEYLVHDTVNGFVVNHKEVISISNGIEKYLSLNEVDKKEMSLKNRAKSELIFDKEKLYHQYVELIKQSK
jgi:glycosyltransferase involved in cell wall biosynthesis